MIEEYLRANKMFVDYNEVKGFPFLVLLLLLFEDKHLSSDVKGLSL